VQQTVAYGVFVDWNWTFPGALRLTLALALLVAAAAIAGRRIAWLVRLIRSGRPAPGRTDDIKRRLRDQLTEVFGQRRLLKWSGPGIAHFLTFWGFVILGITIVEAYGALVLSQDFAFPLFGDARWLGFLEDLFAVAVLVGIGYFAVNRLRNAPERRHRASRFYGSHNGAAWAVLGMIFLVIATLLIYRGAQWNTGHFPYGHSKWPFASYLVAQALGSGAHNQGVETFFLLAQMAVIFSFLVLVTYSKHLHIAIAPLNVLTKREPDALRELLPVADDTGKPIDFADVENLSEDTVFGKGKIEDFTWKGYLDFATCTECGRCQSQCPAWNTGKPLSPKLVIMDLRDHLFAKAPYIIGGSTVPDNAAGRHGRAGRRDRPGRVVVVHHVRCMRRAVPGRHRAHRPHRRHAPLPSAHRVGVPVRGGRHAAQYREQGQPVGHAQRRPRRLDGRLVLRGAPGRAGRQARRRHRLPVLGRVRRRAGGPLPKGHRRVRRTAAHRGRRVRRPRPGRELHW
jgi:hypothetical protein